MIKSSLMPTYYVESIFDIKPKWFWDNNVKIIFCDLDNTLASKQKILPSPKTKKWIQEIINFNIDFIVISNNGKNRVKTFCKPLNTPFIFRALKPLKYTWKRIKNKYNFIDNESIIIGDQFITDILFANRNNIKSILVRDKKRKNNQKFISFFENKIFDMFLKAKILENKKIGN